MFFNDHDNAHFCEIEVMIAEEMYRGKGMAKEALILLMHYAVQHLKVSLREILLSKITKSFS